jgi:hypothetical protein
VQLSLNAKTPNGELAVAQRTHTHDGCRREPLGDSQVALFHEAIMNRAGYRLVDLWGPLRLPQHVDGSGRRLLWDSAGVAAILYPY